MATRSVQKKPTLSKPLAKTNGRTVPHPTDSEMRISDAPPPAAPRSEQIARDTRTIVSFVTDMKVKHQLTMSERAALIDTVKKQALSVSPEEVRIVTEVIIDDAPSKRTA